jgi:hypothetical protein
VQKVFDTLCSILSATLQLTVSLSVPMPSAERSTTSGRTSRWAPARPDQHRIHVQTEGQGVEARVGQGAELKQGGSDTTEMRERGVSSVRLRVQAQWLMSSPPLGFRQR